MSNGYVALNREFRPVGKDESAYRENRELRSIVGSREDYGWKTVLSARRAIVLAEAGSGKTEEFQEQTRRLKNDGHFACFVAVEDLEGNALSDVLDPSEVDQYAAWIESDDHGYFFVDSVDEARLNQKSLRQCVISLQRAIHGHAERTTIVISCRWSDWHPEHDLRLLNEKLSLTIHHQTRTVGPEDALLDLLDGRYEEHADDLGEATTNSAVATKQIYFKIFVLESLDENEQKLFIEKKGVNDPDRFCCEIERNGLLPLASRPKDLIDFVMYWQSHEGHLGSRKEMLHFVTDKRLTEERRGRSDDNVLSIDELRLGAARIAAGMVFGKTLYVEANQTTENDENTTWLDPIPLLPNWTEAAISSLLRKGVFAPASLGRAKFHHRDTMEYLAAVWLKHLLDEGCPYTTIRDQVIATTYGQVTVIPSVRPTLAWLASMDQRFLREIIEREPLVLIQYGDPGSIPIPERQMLLRTYARMHADHNINDDQLANERLWMFATNEIEGVINEIWPEHYEYDLRGDLIRLVQLGQLSGCLGHVRSLLEAPCANQHQGVWALECLIELRDHETVSEFASRFLRTYPHMPLSFQARFASLLFPEFISGDQLLGVIENSKRPDRGTTEGFGFSLDLLWRRCPNSQKERLAGGLARLALREPFIEEYHRISEQFRFVARHLQPICRSLLEQLGDDDPSDALIECMMVVQRSDRQWEGRRDDKIDLKELVNSKPKVKQKLLWANVEEFRRNASAGKAIDAIWDVFFLSDPLSPDYSECDIDWLLRDLTERPFLDDRKIVLSILARMTVCETGPQHIDRHTLTEIVSHDEYLSVWLAEIFTPTPISDRSRESQERLAEARRQRAAREQENRAGWLKFREQLVAHPEKLADPEDYFGCIHDISRLLRRMTKIHDDQFIESIDLVDEIFSVDVKNAYRQALLDHWRLLVFNRETANTWGQVYGRVGVYLEFHESVAKFDLVPRSLAEKAVRLGVFDHHSDWVQRLIDRRPEIGLPIVADQIAHEMGEGAHSSFLHYYARQAAEIPDEIVGALANATSHGLPESESTAALFIEILGKAELNEGAIDRFACLFDNAFRQSIAVNRFGDAARNLGGLIAVDLCRGMQNLKDAWIQLTEDSKSSFSVSLFSMLFDDHGSGLVVPMLPQIAPTDLDYLYRLGRTYLPRREVVLGVARSVDECDRAKYGHEAVFRALTGTQGEEAYRLVCRLAGEEEDYKNAWYLKHAKSMLERDSERASWSEAEVLSFEQNFTAPIKNGRQLHAAVVQALQRIKDGLVEDDASILGLLQNFVRSGARNEGALRNAFLSELIKIGSDKFHSARENQVGTENRPDMFIAGATCPFQVAIEVKQADQWSGNQLLSALEDQLVGQYLYPENRRNGVLLLINTNTSRKWKHPSNRKLLNFSQIAAVLQARAIELSNTEGREEVSVFAIDVPI